MDELIDVVFGLTKEPFETNWQRPLSLVVMFLLSLGVVIWFKTRLEKYITIGLNHFH